MTFYDKFYIKHPMQEDQEKFVFWRLELMTVQDIYLHIDRRKILFSRRKPFLLVLTSCICHPENDRKARLALEKAGVRLYACFNP